MNYYPSNPAPANPDDGRPSGLTKAERQEMEALNRKRVLTVAETDRLVDLWKKDDET